MKRLLLLLASISCTHYTTSATVLVTHGLGTSGIKFYQNSGYIKSLATSAQHLGHTLKSVPWLSVNDPNKDYAGLLPQERIAGAVIIAKAIIDEAAAGQKIILVGHSFGGQVMQCTTRLLNPANKEITDTFVYELVYAIKDLLNDKKETKGLSPKAIFNGVIAGWHLSKIVIAAIEKANIINQHVIDFVKQHLSLDYIEAIKNTWAKAFDEVQRYKVQRNISHTNTVAALYTIGTPFNGSDIFTADMDVVAYHINLYSVDDTTPAMIGSPCAPSTPRTANLRVFFEPTKAYAPGHHQLCGNMIMAPWTLLIPLKLKEQQQGNFDQFMWGTTGAVTFFVAQTPTYLPD